jgi:hypothetical protein
LRSRYQPITDITITTIARPTRYRGLHGFFGNAPQAEFRHVPALGEIDNYRIVQPLLLIIFGELQAQPARLQTHYRVDARIVVFRPVQYGYAERVFLQLGAAAFQSQIGQVAEQAEAAIGFTKAIRRRESRQFPGNGGSIGCYSAGTDAIGQLALSRNTIIMHNRVVSTSPVILMCYTT